MNLLNNLRFDEDYEKVLYFISTASSTQNNYNDRTENNKDTYKKTYSTYILIIIFFYFTIY
jgi:hypothetical protein